MRDFSVRISCQPSTREVHIVQQSFILEFLSFSTVKSFILEERRKQILLEAHHQRNRNLLTKNQIDKSLSHFHIICLWISNEIAMDRWQISLRILAVKKSHGDKLTMVRYQPATVYDKLPGIVNEVFFYVRIEIWWQNDQAHSVTYKIRNKRISFSHTRLKIAGNKTHFPVLWSSHIEKTKWWN